MTTEQCQLHSLPHLYLSAVKIAALADALLHLIDGLQRTVHGLFAYRVAGSVRQRLEHRREIGRNTGTHRIGREYRQQRPVAARGHKLRRHISHGPRYYILRKTIYIFAHLLRKTPGYIGMGEERKHILMVIEERPALPLHVGPQTYQPLAQGVYCRSCKRITAGDIERADTLRHGIQYRKQQRLVGKHHHRLHARFLTAGHTVVQKRTHIFALQSVGG